jgi:hypothetical protein
MRRTALKLAVFSLTFVIGVASAYLVWPVFSYPDIPPLKAVRGDAPVPAPPSSAPQETPKAVTSIKEEWKELTSASFCFVGSQYYSSERDDEQSNSRVIGEGAFNPYGWLPSLRTDKQSAIIFLIKQIPDRSRTHAHVCPLNDATKGELAIYCLQHVLRVNWFALKEDYKRRLDNINYEVSSSQDLLRSIIKTKRGAQEMMRLWAAYTKMQDNMRNETIH